LTAQGWLLHRAPFYNFSIETLPSLTLVTMVVKARGAEFVVSSINVAISALYSSPATAERVPEQRDEQKNKKNKPESKHLLLNQLRN
jgi:hypothetical protein